MKNIVKETWGTLDFDQKQNRLYLSIAHASNEQFKKLIERTVKEVEQQHPYDLIADVSKRVGSSEDTLIYSAVHFKKAMKSGLKRMAIVLPTNIQDREIAEQFVTLMDSKNIRAFNNSRDAIHWLASQSGLEKAA